MGANFWDSFQISKSLPRRRKYAKADKITCRLLTAQGADDQYLARGSIVATPIVFPKQGDKNRLHFFKEATRIA